MTVATGDRFAVLAEEEVRSPKGRLLARLRPDTDYRVTPANLKIVQDLIALGKARAGGRTRAAPNEAEARPARVSGKARTGNT